MKKIEPELGYLERHINQIGRKRGQPFCANSLWYSYFKPELCELVGFGAKRQELKTRAAYDVAYRHLYGLLPDCKHAGMTCFG